MSKKILMASPASFSVDYNINPWMEGQAGQVNGILAAQQWSELRNTLVDLGVDVVVMPKAPDYCPDAVFTANAGLLYYDKFLPSRFKHDERAVEEPYFINWFLEHNFLVDMSLPVLPRNLVSFEGAGDALFSAPGHRNLWTGVGFRSTLSYKAILDKFFDDTEVVVRPLELVDPRFYHLDTCFCPLDTGELLWYPPAFSDYSQGLIELWYDDQAIAVDEPDALKFACNSISVGSDIVMPIVTPYLANKLTRRGYHVFQHDMSEFLKAGGACKCLTLEIF